MKIFMENLENHQTRESEFSYSLNNESLGKACKGPDQLRPSWEVGH